jgi:hypothetical protein
MWQQGRSTVFEELDIDALRVRLQKMSDEQLVKFGKAARFMCSPKANLGQPPREAFVIQLREARAEWRRRHPKTSGGEANATLQQQR